MPAGSDVFAYKGCLHRNPSEGSVTALATGRAPSQSRAPLRSIPLSTGQALDPSSLEFWGPPLLHASVSPVYLPLGLWAGLSKGLGPAVGQSLPCLGASVSPCEAKE